ncbi:unnamed protein product, partial [marine sediment metagenome]
MITGWNYTGNCNQTWNGTGCTFRPYIYVHPITDADGTRAVFLNSAIGYLGYDRDNRYGIVYEDVEDLDPTGYMHNCTGMENFIGIEFQGCENMNVTNTWMNNTHEEKHFMRSKISVKKNSNGFLPFDYQYALSCMLYGKLAASDCNIYLLNVTNSTFANCTAYSPSGAANGGNWNLTGSGTCHNNFTSCLAYDSDTYDFYIDEGVHDNYFTNCTVNDSNMGFFCLSDNNNTFVDCISHNHTLYDFKFYRSVYNDIVRGYANDSTIGVYILCISDEDQSHHNSVTDMQKNPM